LWGWKKAIFIELLFLCISGIEGFTQELSIREMIARYLLRNSFDFGSAQQKNHFTDQLDYSLTANGLMLANWFHDDKVNQVSAVQNLKYKYSLQNDRCLRLSGTFVHNLGFQYYFDSIARVDIDENNLSTKLDIKIEGRIFFTISSIISSRS